MSDIQFRSVLELNTPLIINEIVREHGVDEKQAIEMFFSSSLYEKYVDEGTKIWHYSPAVMSDLLRQELELGEIEYPIGE